MSGGILMNQALLPNGSVVLLKGGDKKLVIYGRKQMSLGEEQQIYDYIGVPYPEGFINEQYTYVFNHAAVEQVVFEGYRDEDEVKFQDVLQQVPKQKPE